MSALPFLSEDEVDTLCKPLTQRAAQLRKLCSLLGVKELPRRPDGFPLVGRKMAEAKLNHDKPIQPGQFNWSK
ncbi:hypothetical protein FVQ98_10525 [Ottowia sp. GY511]|uniref:DUF4224 domain-containing protein n=1 Tax=Ottowia flava TaxID=2675430 RepID=A0ABW4KQF0_9BURK|nr:hypothetical protein [Ottowia sp. GY511]TXK27748.1 hypothetical protein FVQ98_10525 [Ottowia sp. GY511]